MDRLDLLEGRLSGQATDILAPFVMHPPATGMERRRAVRYPPSPHSNSTPGRPWLPGFLSPKGEMTVGNRPPELGRERKKYRHNN